MITRDGRRKVDPVSLDGKPVFLVTDPTYYTKFIGTVPIRTRIVKDKSGDETVLLTDATIAALAELGVDIAELE